MELDAGLIGDHLRDVADTPRLGDLVQDFDRLAVLRRVLQRNLQAFSRVSYVNEGARLPASAVDGQRNSQGRLHEESVQNSAVVAVVIEPVDEALVLDGLRRVRAPDDSLVQVGDADAVVLVVELEKERVKALGGVVD